MKTTTVIMLGLITCTTVLHAQSVYTNSLNGSGKLTATTPVVYREILWTNGVFFSSIETQTLAKGGPYNVTPVRAAERDLPATNIDYQVIALSHDAAVPSTTKIELRSWKFEVPSTTQTEQKKETGNKNPVQNLFIEPLSAPRGNAYDSISLREYAFAESRPKPAWYEWFNPRVFIPKWTELWTTETHATPVVLVLIRF